MNTASDSYVTGSGSRIRSRPSRTVILILLGLLIGFHLVSNYLWLAADGSLPRHDENQYLAKSIRSYRILTGPGGDRWNRLLEVEPKIRPHLFPLTALPFFLIRGVSYDSAALANSFFLALLILAVYGLGRELGGAGRGLLAAFLVSFYPFVLNFSRSFWSEVPLMAVLAGSLYLLLRSREFSRRGYSIAFGLALAAGMLIQQRFVFFIVAPLLAALAVAAWKMIRAGENRGRIAVGVNIVSSLGPAAALTVPYYLRFYRVFSTKFVYGITGEAWDPVGSVLTPAAFLWYPGEFLKQLSLFFFVVCALAAVLVLFHLNRTRLLLLLTVLGGYLAITLYPAKDARYVAALLPLAGLITADALFLLKPRWLRFGMGGLLAAAAIGNYLRVSWDSGPFAVPYHKTLLEVPFSSTPLELVPAARPPAPLEDWKWKEMLRAMADGLEKQRGKVLVVPYLADFNFSTLNYFSLLYDLPLDAVSVGTRGLYRYHFRHLLDSDFTVVKSGRSVPFSHLRFDFFQRTAELLADPPPVFRESHRLLASFALPDDSEAVIWKRIRPAPPAEEIELIEAALEIDPGHPWAYRALGEAYLEAGDPQNAEEIFARVAELLPDWPGGYLGMGRAALERGETARALEHIRRGVEIAPEFPYGRYVLGMAYEQAGELEKAAGEYTLALEGAPDLAEEARQALSRLTAE